MKAYFEADPPLMRVRLHMLDRGLSEARYLADDGSWRLPAEGHRASNAGLVLPYEAVEAIGEAVETFLGHASHAATEARVLREWLAVERERVERMLAR